MCRVLDNFLRYVAVDTQSSESSDTVPTTAKQKNLAKMLFDELVKMGADKVRFDEQKCCVYAQIPATDNGKNDKVLGFIAHLDTSPEMSGKNVKPRIIADYDGEDITLNAEKNIVLKTSIFPEIKAYKGKTIVVTDGTTLLGADDKAGIAEIMTMAENLLENPQISHGRISIAFTPDEEVGGGVDNFDLDYFGADYAYTVDGGGIGELEYENFNAASATVDFHGVSVHTGEAKGKMINAAVLATEFNSLLPADEKPENTQDYEGFYHLESISGTVEQASLFYLVRDHSREKFENRKALLMSLAQDFKHKYGEQAIQINIVDTYYNMREKIEDGYYFLVERAQSAMQSLGIVPKIQPIRGGTDGARLSFMGLPCPNLCTGGHNYHGRYEYCCVQSMEQTVKLLENIAKML